MKALFLDRDGTINIDYGYVYEREKFVFFDGVFDYCRRAADNGYAIIVITNQSGIERGYYTEEDFAAITQYMCEKFKEHGVDVLDVLHCPSLESYDRKPNPGLFLKARDKWGIDMASSVNIGDKERDMEAGRTAGVGTNIVFTGDYGKLPPLPTLP